MKSLLGEEHSFIIESDDDDEEDPTHGDAGAADEDGGSSSDSSSCATPRARGSDGSHPNSYTNQWPQSYRYNIP
jgi:vesicular inhibitory amino acid transporter